MQGTSSSKLSSAQQNSDLCISSDRATPLALKVWTQPDRSGRGRTGS